MVGIKLECIESCDALVGKIKTGDIFMVVDKILSNVGNMSGGGYSDTYPYDRYILCNVKTNELFAIKICTKIHCFKLLNEEK